MKNLRFFCLSLLSLVLGSEVLGDPSYTWITPEFGAGAAGTKVAEEDIWISILDPWIESKVWESTNGVNWEETAHERDFQILYLAALKGRVFAYGALSLEGMVLPLPRPRELGTPGQPLVSARMERDRGGWTQPILADHDILVSKPVLYANRLIATVSDSDWRDPRHFPSVGVISYTEDGRHWSPVLDADGKFFGEEGELYGDALSVPFHGPSGLEMIVRDGWMSRDFLLSSRDGVRWREVKQVSGSIPGSATAYFQGYY